MDKTILLNMMKHYFGEFCLCFKICYQFTVYNHTKMLTIHFWEILVVLKVLNEQLMRLLLNGALY